MKYFIDTEFIEGFHKPLFGKRRHFIDLISIALIAEDGRSYYAISNEWNYKDANPWVRENIIHKLPLKLRPKETVYQMKERCKIGIDDFDKVTWIEGKSNATIAREIYQFINPHKLCGETNMSMYVFDHKYRAKYNISNFSFDKDEPGSFISNPEFYGCYCDYDWVLFCSLFGDMSQLPAGFPMYCRDLKQSLDEVAASIDQINMTKIIVNESDNSQWKVMQPVSKEIINIDDYTLDMKIDLLKSQPDYPKQTNEHNALADAKWNYELYKFLQTK